MNSALDRLEMPPVNNPLRLLAMLEEDEGNSPRLYKDTLDLWTIGIGFCLDRRDMPRQVALYWLDLIIDEIRHDLDNSDQKAVFDSLDDARQCAVINMAYQMGVNGVLNFRNMWGSLKTQNFYEASLHAMESRWARQTPHRARRVAGVIRTGSFTGYSTILME